MGAGEGEANGVEQPYSVELCGGTHVRRTGDIGLFKALSESSVASGVRRIEALTGAAAEAYLAEEEDLLRQAAAALRTSPADLPARVARLVEEQRRLERELADARRALAMGLRPTDLSPGAHQSAALPAVKIGEIAFDGRVVDDVPGRELRSLADDLKRRVGSRRRRNSRRQGGRWAPGYGPGRWPGRRARRGSARRRTACPGGPGRTLIRDSRRVPPVSYTHLRAHE